MAKEIHKVYNEVFDNRTLKALEKLRKEYYEELLDRISTEKKPTCSSQVKNGFVAVKIFRIYTSSFDNMNPYIIGDPRFSRVKKKHEIVYLWARKEFRNLSKAFEAGVRVPNP